MTASTQRGGSGCAASKRAVHPRAWLATIAVTFAIVAAGCSRPSSEDRPSTIVLVVVDTLRADRLATFGGAPGRTPRMDALAEEAIAFSQAYAHAPWTLPSIGSILTGVIPTALWDPETNGVLRPTLTTLAESLTAAGYASHACVNSSLLHPRFGLARGFEEDDYDLFPSRNDFTRTADEAVDDSLSWLERQGEAQNAFLFLHLFDPHLDYLPTRESLESLGTLDAERGERFEPGDEVRQPSYQPDEPTRRWIETLHDAEVLDVDRALGRLFDGLEKLGRYDDAVLVLTSDHGEEFWDHGRFEHGHTLFEELLHVPLVMRLPGGRHAGARIDAPAGHIDIVPTLLELASCATPRELQGRSLLSRIGDEPASEPVVVSEFLLYGPERKAIRRGRYKLLTNEQRVPTALYDLEADPGETEDVLASRPEEAASLRAELMRWVGEATEAPRPPFRYSKDADLRRLLGALRYVTSEDAATPENGAAQESEETPEGAAQR